MNKTKRILLIILGAIIIALGIALPMIFMTQKVYYEMNEKLTYGGMNYNFVITSTDEKLEINSFTVTVEFENKPNQVLTINSWQESNSKNGYQYKFTVFLGNDWVDVEDIEDIKLNKTNGSIIELEEKSNTGFRVALMLLGVVVGVVLVLVGILTSITTKADKKILDAAKTNIQETFPDKDVNSMSEEEIHSLNEKIEDSEEKSVFGLFQEKQEEKYKECEYCASQIPVDAIVCTSCGAKVRKK